MSAISLARTTRANATQLAQAAQSILDAMNAGQPMTARDAEKLRDMARAVGFAAAKCEASLIPQAEGRMHQVAALLEPVNSYIKGAR